MNSSKFYKRVRFALKLSSNTHFANHKYFTSFSKPLTLSELKSSHLFLKYTKFTSRNIFSSSLTKSNDSKIKDNPGKNKDVYDDQDFHNVLNDFAKDFGVGSDSVDMLNDIKKQIEESESCHRKDSKHDSEKAVTTEIVRKFKDFTETDAKVIYSFEETKPEENNEDWTYHIEQELESELPLHVQRGVSGVFDIVDLVEALQQEKLKDIAVISIPKEIHYTDFLVLATANSLRHSKAVTEYIIKLYKKKKLPNDPFAVVEGEKACSWKAIDMGNIVLHIFLEETRKYYDIESLWLFDPKYDTGGTLIPDPFFEAIKEQMEFFNSIQDADSDNPK